MSEITIPAGKTVYGYGDGGKKYKSGQTVTTKQVPAGILKILSGNVKKASNKKTASGKNNYRKV